MHKMLAKLAVNYILNYMEIDELPDDLSVNAFSFSKLISAIELEIKELKARSLK